jgi:dolichol-phosphate mannosyltransferase
MSNVLRKDDLKLLSVVLPAREEAGCVAATVEHLHVELRLQDVPHEIVVVDDRSVDATWKVPGELEGKISELTGAPHE